MDSNFYRRDLPQTCISFSSKQGRKIFKSSLINNGLKSFYCLIEQHTTQSEPAYCGPSTLVVILNALAVDPRRKWKGPWRWYDEHMLNCCIDLEEVKTTGITLSTFICLAKCQGLSVRGKYAAESNLNHFRDVVRDSCMEDENECDQVVHKFLVVSYNRRILKQTGSGHFSPVAAYDSISDSVLILDTARFKYGAHWVPIPLLFQAMCENDPETNKSRGFVLLSPNQAMDLLESILFRTKQSHSHLRQYYEDYLSSLPNNPPTLDQVVSYWTQQGNNPFYVFELLMPQYIPIVPERQKQVKELISLLSKMIQNDSHLVDLHLHEMENRCNPSNEKLKSLACIKNCAGNSCITVPISCAESIFIIYLASLKNADDRMDVLKIKLGVEFSSNSTLKQILAEAELVKLAMDVNHLLENY